VKSEGAVLEFNIQHSKFNIQHSASGGWRLAAA
jgi:hypothetical protein